MMVSTTVIPLSVKSEAALEQMLLRNPQVIGKGFTILENQVPASRGFIDLLGVDRDHTLVVAELKRDADDHILAQALEYYDFARDNIERFARIYHEQAINPRVEPRLVLIAGDFTPGVLAAVRYLNIPLALYIYEYLAIGEQKGLYLREIDIPPPRVFKHRRLMVEEHIDYITDVSVRDACRRVLDWLRDFGSDQLEFKGLKYRISVKHRGNNLINIHTRRAYFLLSWQPDWVDHRLDSWDDFGDEMQEALRESFLQMGGYPSESDLGEEEEG